MVAEEVIITLSGGAPWGFRLQGGVEHQKPLQVRKRSKACRAGLREADELVTINDHPCGTLSHAQAMNLIDSSPGVLHIRVKRAPAGFQSVVLVTRAPSPRIDKEYRAALHAMSPTHPQHAPVREVHRSHSSLTSGLTSPPGSEAYYGETDSDADVAGYSQRRQKRRSPSNSSPGKPTGRDSPEGGETSEMSGYDNDQGLREGGQEEDSSFLEIANVPLVSPERAKEALMLSSRNQFVPMVGPVNKPVDEELTTTYMEKAKQAKLNRGDTMQDKQVKEAKSKCRTIACLLTDAPNPHSKGVLMFKKRRQRSKKYTLTSFGSVDEDKCQDSQEEDGMFPGSESEFDDDVFSAAPDPTWDSDYLDMLERRATAGAEGRGDGAEDTPSPGLSETAGKGAQLFEQQRKRAAEHAKKVETAQLNLDERCTRQKSSLLPTEAAYDAEERSIDASTGKVPPPVAPKPRVIQEAPQILQAGGKGAQLFARRQNRMSMYAVDAAPYTPYQQDVTLHSAVQPLDSTLNPSLPPQFKYSPNIRAPPPIGYNPLLSPSIPTGPQRNTSKPESKGRGRSHKEGIKALDAMRRQPYQLNSAMFSSATNLSPMPSYQAQRQQQIPIKKARVYEIKRFSTPTPMSAPTLSPKVIAPRSATTLGERLTDFGMTSPPLAHFTPSPASPPSQPAGWPSLPKFSAMPIPNPVLPVVPTPYSPVSYTTGLQTAKQFQSAPELSILSSLPPVQAPKPHFVATKGGVLPHVWRPGAM
uniref:synaptopodin 2-like protein n=1 Tax=Monopterus albus TaxID=43700 RepID=UPI0009B44037|nr:synaptopodin 2-like protein [Monopterus albus]